MKQIVLMIGLMALVGCGKNKPVPPQKTKATAGIKLWEFETGNYVNSPTIGSDGTVYVGSYDKKLYALSSKTGVKLWEFETGDNVSSDPTIGSDGICHQIRWWGRRTHYLPFQIPIA